MIPVLPLASPPHEGQCPRNTRSVINNTVSQEVHYLCPSASNAATRVVSASTSLIYPTHGAASF